MKEKNLGIIDNELHEIKEQTIKNILGSKRVYYIKILMYHYIIILLYNNFIILLYYYLANYFAESVTI